MAQQKKGSGTLQTIGISIVAVLLAYILSLTDTLQILELKFLDMRYELRGPVVPEDNPIVILAIDDQSDEATAHRWPWPRSYFAHVIENLNEAGAAVIGVDVIFDQPDKYSPENDDELSRVLAENDNVVLAGKLLRSTQRKYSTIIPPYEKFQVNDTPWGIVAIEADADGFYRRYLVADAHQDSMFGSFAAHIMSLYNNDPDLELENNPGAFIVNDRIIPKYEQSGMLINFHGPAYSFQYYSFVNVLDDSEFDINLDYDLDVFDDPGDVEFGLPPGLKYTGELKDKIVLIGATMQELHDNFPTPFLEYTDDQGNPVKVEMPGVEIHANALLTMMNNNYLYQVPFFTHILIVVLAIVLVWLITRFLPTLWSTIVAVLLVLGYIALSMGLFLSDSLVMPMVNPILVIVFAYVGHTVYQYLETQREKKVLRGAFAHYVPEGVVQEIINNPDKLQLGGEERVVSVLFSDVAGFTSISEKLTPRELVTLLNEYLTAMTDIVLANNGIIDKYEGDAIMAEFGVPVPYEEHPQAACRTALQMQKKLAQMREKWKAEGRPALQARVGINTGEVIVGNMGSQTVFDYTVMGDHVNLGARLEGANKFYDTLIMISEFTYEYVKNDFYTRPLDLIKVKGKDKPIEVFELIAERDEKLPSKYLEMLSVYQRGVSAFRNRAWRQAIDYFDFCLNLYPDDYPSKMYRKRCLEYKINEPAPDWDGVTTMTEK